MKKMLISIVLLTSIFIISFSNKETNFIMPKNKVVLDKNSFVDIDYQNKHLKIPIEEYIIGVVAAEMPASFETEALKAQAVASRTYLINTMSTNLIDTTTSNQVYIDKIAMKEKWQEKYEEYYNKIAKCVKETKEEIITYNEKPIKAFYHSMSNGYTDSSLNVFNESYDYLKITESSWDKDNSNTITMTKQDFCNKLNIECNNIKINKTIKDESDRIKRITINGKEFIGTEIRTLLNLRSTDFKITINNNIIEITTKGYGHGVGMSQYGANYMAKEGYTYKEILKYYYQNIEISNL